MKKSLSITSKVSFFVTVIIRLKIFYLNCCFADSVAPVIKIDSEYPKWLSNISLKVIFMHYLYAMVKIMFVFPQQGPSKASLTKKLESEGVDAMSTYEIKRLKRLITLEQIKDKNLSNVAEKG